MITKSHAYLVNELNLAEDAEEKSAEFKERIRQTTFEAFWNRTCEDKKWSRGRIAC